MNQKINIQIIFIIITSIFSILFIVIYPTIELRGDQVVYLHLGEKYVELGYSTSFYIKDKVEINNNVKPYKIGTYQVEYKIPSLNITKKRTIKVIPKKTLDLPSNFKKKTSIYPSQKKSQFPYYIVKNYYIHENGSKIIKEEDLKIELIGNEVVTLNFEEPFLDPGIVITNDLDIPIETTIEKQIHNDLEYDMIYTISSSLGKKSITRKIIKKPQSNKVIYLTFDDGPSYTVTSSILNILKEENVKATFFVLNHNDSLNHLIKREYEEGHTIALHGFTHNYSYIYESETNFLEDLKQISNKVEAITGEKSKIIRFPGGSSNTVSKFNLGIMTRLTKLVENLGYHYFDWNVSSGDASGYTTKEKVYQSVISGLNENENIVLMHDFENNYATLNALRDIIHYGKEHGYRFSNITFSTKPIKHPINN